MERPRIPVSVRWLRVATVLACGLALAASASGQVVCYVDHSRPNDTGDGFSWGAAKQTIQAAVDISAPFLCDQIWVREGTYVLTSPLTIDFRTPDIYGGFAGGEFQLSDRDWIANETIIDGNDAVAHVIVIQNAAAPIIDGFTITGGTLWGLGDEGGGIHMSHCDGLVPEIRNNYIHGNGSIVYGNGGGMYVWNCAPVISNNIFDDNDTKYEGYHIELDGSTAAITNNTFLGNFSIHVSDGSPPYVNPVISNNILWSDSDASKITHTAFTLPVVQYNLIRQASYAGIDGNINQDPLLFGTRPRLRAGSPAIDAGLNTAPGVPAIDFEGDARIIDGDENGTATVDMGADEAEPAPASSILYVDGSVPTTGSGSSWDDPMKSVKDAVEAAQSGEEVWVRAGTYLFSASAISTNTIGVYGGFAGGETQRDQRDPVANETILDGQGSSGTLSVGTAGTVDGFTFTGSTGHSAKYVSNCKFSGNSGYLSLGTDGVVDHSRFENNTGMAFVGAGTIKDSVFLGNNSALSGGAINAGTLTVVDRCAFYNNSAGWRGGAIVVASGADLEVRNSLFVGNEAGADDSYEGGGAIWTYNADILVENSTFYGNAAVNGGMGGAIGSYFNETVYHVVNSAFRDNTDDQGGWSKNFRGSPTVTYSIMDETRSGTGNINGNPLFVDPDGVDNTVGTEDDDLRLGAMSPAADAGNNAGIDICAVDLDGGQRLLDDPDVSDTGSGSAPIVDMGAYERGGSATEYTLTMAVTGNGTTDPSVGTHDYAVCSEVVVTAIPDGGAIFSDWTGDVAEPSQAVTTVSMLGDRSATANFSQPATADVGIDKTNWVNEVMLNETFNYKIAVWSFGPDAVSGVAVSDVMPAELESCSWICEPFDGTSCTASGSGDIDDTVSLPAMSYMRYTVTCTVKSDATGPVTNSATVSLAAGDTDPDLNDNSAGDTDEVVAEGSCGAPDTRDLSGIELDVEQTWEACQLIITGDLLVQTDGDATLRAGGTVRFDNDFGIEQDADLTVEIDPTLLP